MADETYRQRRSIQPEELNEPQQPDLMAAFRNTVSEASEDDGDNYRPRTPAAPSLEGTDLVLKGNIPPAMQAAVARKQMAKQQEQEEEVDFPIRKATPPRKKFDERPVMSEILRVTGSDSLERMIEISRSSTGIYEEVFLPSIS